MVGISTNTITPYLHFFFLQTIADAQKCHFLIVDHFHQSLKMSRFEAPKGQSLTYFSQFTPFMDFACWDTRIKNIPCWNMLEYYLSQGTAACSEPFATTVFPWRTRNIFHSLVPSESGRLNNFSWNLSGLGLGTGEATKTDNFGSFPKINPFC